ncbi:MAG: lipopolysaccharide kinase InaA family protein [Cycloclasticus sp.]
MHYIADKWRDILVFNQLDNSEKLWHLKTDWFEEPNTARGGWSGVSRVELKLPAGGSVAVFLKRQENHCYRSFLHPIKGLPTLLKEFNSMRSFAAKGIDTLEPVFFEYWQTDGCQRAVLITKELEGYMPLSADEYKPGGELAGSASQQSTIILKLAELTRAMHRHNFQHNCFYLKHVFAKPVADGELELRVIDLEKVKVPYFQGRAAFRDLYSLARHAQHWCVRDQLRFYKHYRQEAKLRPASKKLWRRIAAKINSKA